MGDLSVSSVISYNRLRECIEKGIRAATVAVDGSSLAAVSST
jgi:hypothetical protein